MLTVTRDWIEGGSYEGPVSPKWNSCREAGEDGSR